MFRLAVAFLVIAVIAGVFGFGVIADYSWAGAKIVCYLFLGLALLTYLSETFKREF